MSRQEGPAVGCPIGVLHRLFQFAAFTTALAEEVAFWGMRQQRRRWSWAGQAFLFSGASQQR